MFKEGKSLQEARKFEAETDRAWAEQQKQLEVARASADPKALTNYLLGRNPEKVLGVGSPTDLGKSISDQGRAAHPDVTTSEQIAINAAAKEYEKLIRDINHDFLTSQEQLLSLVERRKQLEIDIAGAQGVEQFKLKSEAAKMEADMLNVLQDIKNEKDNITSVGAMQHTGAAEKGSLEAYQAKINRAQKNQDKIEKNTADSALALKQLVPLFQSVATSVKAPPELIDTF